MFGRCEGMVAAVLCSANFIKRFRLELTVQVAYSSRTGRFVTSVLSTDFPMPKITLRLCICVWGQKISTTGLQGCSSIYIVHICPSRAEFKPTFPVSLSNYLGFLYSGDSSNGPRLASSAWTQLSPCLPQPHSSHQLGIAQRWECTSLTTLLKASISPTFHLHHLSPASSAPTASNRPPQQICCAAAGSSLPSCACSTGPWAPP